MRCVLDVFLARLVWFEPSRSYLKKTLEAQDSN
jgi:hypothetical protein